MKSHAILVGSLLVSVLLSFLSLIVPSISAAVAAPPPALPDATDLDLPLFKLPYAPSDNERVSWSGGLHQCGNLDGLATFPVGQGSGLDFAMPQGTKVRAMATGTVIGVNDQDRGGFGCYVIVRHEQGGTAVLYGHMDCRSLAPLRQQFEAAQKNAAALWAPQGAVLGDSGRSGISPSPHLHIELASPDCSAARLPGCADPQPLDWGLAHFAEGYRIYPYLKIGSNRSEARNYEGSTVRGEETREIADFAYYDSGIRDGQPIRRPMRAIVTVGMSFQCPPTDDCEVNVPGATTQFAKEGAGGKLYSENGRETVVVVPHLVQVPPHQRLAPGESVDVSVIFQNGGQETWKARHYALVHVGGPQLGDRAEMALDQDVPAGQQVEWAFAIRAPWEAGVHRSLWRLSFDGNLVGPLVVIEVAVDLGPLSALLQKVWEQIQEWLRQQWEAIVRRLEEMIRAELQRRLDEWMRQWCCAAPASVGLLVFSFLWSRRRRGRGAGQE